MNDAKTPPVAAEPGHYGRGYGEQRPPTASEPPPALESASDAPAGLEPIDAALDAAPESEKAGLIFERS